MVRKYHVTLTPEERSELEAMTRRGRSAARTLVRAWVLLKCDESGGGPAASDAEVADARWSAASRPSHACGSGSSRRGAPQP